MIDGSDDFDFLTDELVGRLAVSTLKRPAIEHLISKMAKKASVPKSALMEVFNNYSGDGDKDKGKGKGRDEGGRQESMGSDSIDCLEREVKQFFV